MSTEKIDLKLAIETAEAASSVRDVKMAIKDLKSAMLQFGEGTKEFYEAAKAAGELKEKIDRTNAAIKLLQPGGGLKAMTESVHGVAAGFSIAAGASALFGDQNEELEKTIRKVEGSIALLNGVSKIREILEEKSLVISGIRMVHMKIMNALFGAQAIAEASAAAATGEATVAQIALNTAMEANPIGLILVAVVALGSAYLAIKNALFGVSDAYGEMAEQGKKTLELDEKKLRAIEGQEKVQKVMGKTEREILLDKQAQLKIGIKDAAFVLLAAKNQAKAQEETAERGKAILGGIMKFLNAPITILLKAVDAVMHVMGKTSTLAKDLNDKITNLFFNPEKTKKEGQKTIDEAQMAFDKMTEEYAGTVLDIKEIDKKEADDAQKRAQEAFDKFKKIQDNKVLATEVGSRKEFDAKQKALVDESDYLKVHYKAMGMSNEDFNKQILDNGRAMEKNEEDFVKKLEDAEEAARQKKLALDIESGKVKLKSATEIAKELEKEDALDLANKKTKSYLKMALIDDEYKHAHDAIEAERAEKDNAIKLEIQSLEDKQTIKGKLSDDEMAKLTTLLGEEDAINAEFDAKQIESAKAKEKAITDEKQKQIDKRIALEKQLSDAAQQFAGDTLDFITNISSKSSESQKKIAQTKFNIEKGLNVGKTVMSTVEGVLAATAEQNYFQAALVGTLGAASLAKILSTKFDSSGSAGGSGSVGGSRGNGAGIGGNFQAQSLKQIGGGFNNPNAPQGTNTGKRGKDAQKVYVVASDITSSQNKNAVLSRRASFSL